MNGALPNGNSKHGSRETLTRCCVMYVWEKHITQCSTYTIHCHTLTVTCAYMYMYIHTHTLACTLRHAHMRAHTHTHTHTHTHMHAHTHTHSLMALIGHNFSLARVVCKCLKKTLHKVCFSLMKHLETKCKCLCYLAHSFSTL